MKMETNHSLKRILYIDAIKGFAIFCVLWGHSLQYLKDDSIPFHNPMFEFIYSFHMPLFFLVSGFFFRSSLKLNLKDFLFKKSVQLILPCLVWAIIFYFLKYKSIEAFYPSNWPWFLRELFLSYLMVYASLKWQKKTWLACSLSIAFSLVAPYFSVQRSFLPIFWLGIYLKDHYLFISKHVKQIVTLSGILFAICLFFWNGDYTICVTNFPNLLKINSPYFNYTDIYASLFRTFIGMCGSLFWFMLFCQLFRNNSFFLTLGQIGENTLAIYLLQGLFLEFLLDQWIDFSGMSLWTFDLLLTPLIALFVLVICMLVIKIVKKNKYAELFLFGKK